MPNYNQTTEIPVKIIKSSKMQFISGLFEKLLKRSGNFVLILAIISSQVYLLSAFEAHVINVTARICIPLETRTPGYWKTHQEVTELLLPVTLGCDEITTFEQAFDILDSSAEAMRKKLESHLLAMKFNIKYYGVGEYFTESCYYEGQDIPINTTINELVAEADLLLCNSGTREELEDIKDKLDCLNNLHQIRECATSFQLTRFFALPTVTIEETYSTSTVTESQIEPEMFLLEEEITTLETTTTTEEITTTTEATTTEESTPPPEEPTPPPAEETTEEGTNQEEQTTEGEQTTTEGETTEGGTEDGSSSESTEGTEAGEGTEATEGGESTGDEGGTGGEEGSGGEAGTEGGEGTGDTGETGDSSSTGEGGEEASGETSPETNPTTNTE